MLDKKDVMRTTANSMFALWPGDQLNFSIFIKPTFGFAGQPAASEAGHIANTNVGNNWIATVDRLDHADKILVKKKRKSKYLLR